MRLINPTLDVVFKMLLLADQRLLRSMIEAVFGLREPLADVTVLNPEMPGVSHEDHGVVLDVRVRLGSGEEIDLEMATRELRAAAALVVLLGAALLVTVAQGRRLSRATASALDRLDSAADLRGRARVS